MSLKFEFEGTAAWRAKNARKYPHDQRNAAAVDLLNRLSAQSPDPELDARHEELSNEIDGERWSAVHSEVLGDIGFRWNPQQIDEVYLRIIGMLSNGTPMIVEIIRDLGEKRVLREQAAVAAGRHVNGA